MLSACRRSPSDAVRLRPALVRSEIGDCAGGRGFESRLRDVERGLDICVTNLDKLELREDGGWESEVEERVEELEGPTGAEEEDVELGSITGD